MKIYKFKYFKMLANQKIIIIQDIQVNIFFHQIY